MPRKFDDIEIGDQLELPAHRGALIFGGDETKDPNRPIRIAIVTHIWHDPVEDKEFVGLAYLRDDGSYGKPTEKRTITGLARTGWRRAECDWIVRMKSMKEAGGKVVSINRRPLSQ